MCMCGCNNALNTLALQIRRHFRLSGGRLAKSAIMTPLRCRAQLATPSAGLRHRPRRSSRPPQRAERRPARLLTRHFTAARLRVVAALPDSRPARAVTCTAADAQRRRDRPRDDCRGRRDREGHRPHRTGAGCWSLGAAHASHIAARLAGHRSVSARRHRRRSGRSARGSTFQAGMSFRRPSALSRTRDCGSSTCGRSRSRSW